MLVLCVGSVRWVCVLVLCVGSALSSSLSLYISSLLSSPQSSPLSSLPHLLSTAAEPLDLVLLLRTHMEYCHHDISEITDSETPIALVDMYIWYRQHSGRAARTGTAAEPLELALAFAPVSLSLYIFVQVPPIMNSAQPHAAGST